MRISNNMFLLSYLLLIPVILVNGKDLKIDGYSIQIKKDVSDEKSLASIEVDDDPSKKLNLSGLALGGIYDRAFRNLSNLTDLDLSKNSLKTLKKNLFTSLGSLESLNLSHNNLYLSDNIFVGLINLKVLDLSNNKIKNLEAGYFFGLTESCVIWLKGNIYFNTMSTKIFEENQRLPHISICKGPNYSDSSEYIYSLNIPHIKICIDDTKLISVEHHTKDEELASGCKKLPSPRGVLFLNESRIAEFQKGWYKLRDLPIHEIDLSSNYITRFTSEMLNDLPESISIVNLANNKIKNLKNGVLVNEHLREIHFMSNYITEIEEDTFINTNLTTLSLVLNRLMDTKFAVTLPPTLTNIDLQANVITEIPNESFSKLNNLEVLILSNNHIVEIHRDSLHGLSGLRVLSLSNNKLIKIEASYLKTLEALEILDLNSNEISELDSGVFADLKNIKTIDLSWNSLRNVTNSLTSLPDSLKILDLQHNSLKNLKAGTFVNSPKSELLLSYNKIANIEDGSFNLPNLDYLGLAHNYLTVIYSGMLQGLKNVRSLRLEENNITRIEKCTFENFVSLCKLIISDNPIKTLENGTLYGLLKNNECNVQLKGVPIEMVYGGVFSSCHNSSFDRLSESNNTLL